MQLCIFNTYSINSHAKYIYCILCTTKLLLDREYFVEYICILHNTFLFLQKSLREEPTYLWYIRTYVHIGKVVDILCM